MVLRILFIILLVIHGLIHLMGFTKAFKIAEIEQLTQQISKPVGVLWLISTLLFIGAALLFAIKKDGWWILATAALVFSQLLIFLFWQDAKFGTIANVIVLLVTLVGYGNWSFKQMVQHEITTFKDAVDSTNSVSSIDNQKELPPVVARWLKTTGVTDKHPAASAYLHQTGKMRTSANGKWMTFRSHQWVKTNHPGFFWTVHVNVAPGINIAGRDKYINGKGNMLIKLLSLFTVADAKGKETDQGSMVRYMAEIIWCPSAAMHDYFEWEQMDAQHAQLTMKWEDVEATGIFTFNENGLPVRFEADRYYSRKSGATMERWVAEIEPESYRKFDGVFIPSQISIAWKLKEGDYHWLDMEVTEVQYNTLEKRIF